MPTVARTSANRAVQMSDPLGEGRVRQVIAENVRLERTLRALEIGIESHSIVAFTDRHGIIQEVNDKFVEVSKYSREELIGAPQNIVNSGRHSREFFRDLWSTIAKGGVWQGTICNRAKDGSEYWVAATIVPLHDANQRIERYLSIRTDVTQLQAAEHRVRHLAYTDQLTGLPNRTRMLNHLNENVQLPGNDRRLFVTVEFDDLGMINDTFGFAAGDRFLRSVSERFARLCFPDAQDSSPLERCPDLIARIGSASFAASLSGFSIENDLAPARMHEVAQQFARLLDNVVKDKLGSSIEPHIRVGYFDYVIGGDLDAADIFSRAEIARSHLKGVSAAGSPAVAGFDQCMVDQARTRTELVLELRQCVPAGELELYLQPVVGVDAETLGYEGLVRWNNRSRGVVSPEDFIPLAERTGIIVELGNWVLNEACRLLGQWAKREETQHLTLSVNVSERQLRPKVLLEAVHAALLRHDAPPHRLKLEVTESVLHGDLERSVQVLDELRSLGVHISLDDFGTGYSSLSNLHRLPVQQLKIDRSFVESVMNSAAESAIVETIVRLARIMNLGVVAEGVENEDQLRVLKQLGVEAFQGYLFGKPQPYGD